MPKFPKQRVIVNPPEWWEAFEAQAEAEGMSLSQFAGAAMLDRLPHRIRRELPERAGRGQPKREPAPEIEPDSGDSSRANHVSRSKISPPERKSSGKKSTRATAKTP